MEFVPFGQDGIPPTAGKATKYRMLYNSLEFGVSKPSIVFLTPWHGGPGRRRQKWWLIWVMAIY
jgi:hypothetical protein